MPEKFNAKQWLLIGLLIRLAVMPFTLHGDLIHIYKWPHYLVHGEWDVYGIVADVRGTNYYPPLSVLFFAAMQFVLGGIFSNYEGFLDFLLEKGTGARDIFASDDLFLSLFLMKVPYLIFDVLLILCCWKMLNDDRDRRVFAVFWAVNPLVIYGTYMVGQFSLIPTYFVVLACYLSLRKGYEAYACLSIAAGCLFKVFPILFLPIIVLICSRSIKDFLRLSLIGIGPVIVFYGIFYMISGEILFKMYSDLSYNVNTGLTIESAAMWVSRVAVYGLVCFHILFKRRGEFDYPLLIQYFLIIYIAVYWGFIMNQTHYFIWFVPFFILYVQRRPPWRKLFYAVLLIILLGGLRSRASSLGIFAPIHPELFLSLPSLKDVTGFLFNQKIYAATLKWLFCGVTGGMVLAILKDLYWPSKTKNLEVKS